MTEDEMAQAMAESGSMVSQNQVNDIFGDIESSLANKPVTGLRMLIDKNSESQTRLPMLEVVFDRLVRFLSISYRSFTSFTVDVEIGKTATTRFGEYIDGLPVPSMIAVVKAIEWDNFMLVTIDSLLTYSLIDILFGGRKLPPSLKVEGRPYTMIEQTIITSMTDILLNDLSLSFEPVTPITFQLDRLESNPKFATISRPEDVVVILRLNVKMEQRHGFIELVVPYATIEPVKKLLQKTFLGERGTKDPNWSKYIEMELSNAKVELSVRLNGVTSNVKNVASIKVGDTIVLDKEPTDDIFVTIGKQKISTGKIGKVNDNVAIKLSEPLNLNKYKN